MVSTEISNEHRKTTSQPTHTARDHRVYWISRHGIIGFLQAKEDRSGAGNEQMYYGWEPQGKDDHQKKPDKNIDKGIKSCKILKTWNGNWIYNNFSKMGN